MTAPLPAAPPPRRCARGSGLRWCPTCGSRRRTSSRYPPALPDRDAFSQRHHPIPFGRYERGSDGVARSASDHAYGYADALRDGVVRPVLFLAYSGTATWRTALDPHGDWMPTVLAAADRRLSQVRAVVGAWHHRTGKPHGTVHAELRAACGGPASAQATAQQLQDRTETVRRWARERG